MNEINPFIIVSSQRSGSTFIRTWLNSHTQIHCYGEVFLRHYLSEDGFREHCNKSLVSKLLFYAHYNRLTRGVGLQLLPNTIVNDYLNHIIFSKNFPPPWTDIDNRENIKQCRIYKPLVGFKIMYNTLRQVSSVNQWIFREKPLVIHITRKNLLRKYVSGLRMSGTKVAHSKNSIQGSHKVSVNIREFIKFADQQIHLEQSFREECGKYWDCLELSYENIFDDIETTRKSILQFLGLKDEVMPLSDMKKIGSERLRDDIENWDEVFDALINTQYGLYLDQYKKNVSS